MTTNNDEFANIVETEIIKGEQDDVLEEYPPSKKEERIQKKPYSKTSALKIVKQDVPQVTVKSTASLRIEELARPTKRHVLITLKEKVSILPPAFVDNLIRLIEIESCLTPEEAAQTLRRKKRRRKKIIQPLRKWMKEITEDITHAKMLDKDVTLCQYLMAEHFVKSILGHQCETRKKDIREITAVICRRLMSLDDRYIMDVQNGDRATQQMRFLADIVACWIAEILIEVGEVHKETLEEYCKKREMKTREVDDVDVNQIKSEKDDDDNQTKSEKDDDDNQTKSEKDDDNQTKSEKDDDDNQTKTEKDDDDNQTKNEKDDAD